MLSIAKKKVSTIYGVTHLNGLEGRQVLSVFELTAEWS